MRKKKMIELMNPAAIKHEEWSNVRSRLNRHGELRRSTTLPLFGGTTAK
uniref:Uncharacterized protein n=1 Tax=Wuchereria bancrofti TaxID=6293 RepID=A0AAF5PJ93_WUCBA